MESVEAEVKKHTIHICYAIYAKIVSIKWMNNPDGWFVHFEGSRESLNFGIERPLWSEGQVVKITFQGQEPDA